MKIKYCVLTKVPSDEDKEGNLYDDVIYYDKSLKKWRLVGEGDCGEAKNWKSIKLPVFALGEILILDETGREIGGDRRKPSKWFVEYKEFYNVEEAIKCSEEVHKKEGDL